METVNINGLPLGIKEYKGHRVVTFRDIDMVHKRPEGTARKRFNSNRKYFIEGEDFFVVKPSDIQMSEFQTSEINNRGTTLLTESGYLMIVKSFTDDLAWSVQRQLINSYFRVRELTNSYNEILLMLVQKQNEFENRIKKVETEQTTVSQPLAIESGSIVFDFINECCERRCGTCNNVTTADLYRAFEKWCLKKNTNAVSKYTFINQICLYFQTDDKKSIRKNVAG
nr:ORF6N domain-containing protein [Ruminococcus sp.]